MSVALELGRNVLRVEEQAARRRQSSERTTTPSNVPLQKRVDDHPNESLIVAASTSDIAQGGKVVFCRACKTELFNKSRSAPLPPSRESRFDAIARGKF